MRLRNIPGAKEHVAESPFTINEPESYKGHFSDLFGGKPVQIEIGMGKGTFITQKAQQDPDTGFIGIEMYSSVLLRGLQKVEAMENPPENLRMICMDANDIEDVFGDREIDRIYLNFSDPWPKEKHAKRRLTHRRFLDKYYQILKDDGFIEFKTDNKDLFEFSVEEVQDTDGWQIVTVTRDLHHDTELMKGNIMTEYEKKFSGLGNKICKLVFQKVSK